MQVEATYEDGQLTFKQPLALKRRRVSVLVSIPDDAVETADAPPHQEPSGPATDSISRQIAAILNPWREQLSTLKPADTDALRDLLAQEWEAHHRAQN